MRSSIGNNKIFNIYKKQQLLQAFTPINQSKHTFLFIKQQNVKQTTSIVLKKTKFNNKQKQRFLIFVQYFQKNLSQIQPREIRWYVFKAMARFLVTRNFQQCRSHYLKIIQKFKNIQNYLLKGRKKIPQLLLKVKQKQAKLIKISQQFNFNLINVKNDKTFIIKQQQTIKVKQIPENFNLQLCIDKNQKNDQIKTADNYQSQQIHVKKYQEKNSCSIFSHQSKFKPCTESISIYKPQKHSLRSFDDSEQQQSTQKKQSISQNAINSYVIPNFYSMKTEGVLSSNPLVYNNSMLSGSYAAFPIYQMPSQTQKMNNFMQMQQYYFQMWATQNIYYKGPEQPQPK